MKALVVGNGEPPSQQLFDQLVADGYDLLLCADGGADTVRRFGGQPDVIVGDLDSISDPDGPDVIRRDADSTGTDLNKSLEHALTLGVTEAVLTGVTGRRTDHTLWNLSLLATFGRRLRLAIVDDYCRMWWVPAGGHATITGPVGTRLSLSPLTGSAAGITTQGLRWALTGDTLRAGERDGISNEIAVSPATVCVAGPGDLLLVTQAEDGPPATVRVSYPE